MEPLSIIIWFFKQTKLSHDFPFQLSAHRPPFQNYITMQYLKRIKEETRSPSNFLKLKIFECVIGKSIVMYKIIMEANRKKRKGQVKRCVFSIRTIPVSNQWTSGCNHLHIIAWGNPGGSGESLLLSEYINMHSLANMWVSSRVKRNVFPWIMKIICTCT